MGDERDHIDIQKELFDKKGGKLRKYQELVVGSTSLWFLLKYELIMLLASWVPGALGMVLRAKLYPLVLGRVGRNVTFGTNVVIRHPRKIEIGDNVVIDDNCVLDAKGWANQGIRIGNGVFLGRNTILSCKNGDIAIDDGANIGFNCEVFSAGSVRLGKNILVAAYSYFVGGTHTFARTDVPIIDQPREARGIEIGDNAWIGAHVVVLDGCRVGRDAIIGAGAVVNSDIPDYAIAVGMPARVVRSRLESAAEKANAGA
ncbi:MAG: acyltransferase [candidate division KSB1 bacterium]|nr:acyltransferase [candidate division KSB1 bacterium]